MSQRFPTEPAVALSRLKETLKFIGCRSFKTMKLWFSFEFFTLAHNGMKKIEEVVINFV